MFRVMLALALAGLVAPAGAHASVDGKHSGRIVATSHEGRTIALEELGAFGVHHRRIIRKTIELTSSTRIALITRSDNAGEWRGGFTERPLRAADLEVGDYATVTMTKRRGRLVAIEVAVVRPSQTAEPDAEPGRVDVLAPTR